MKSIFQKEKSENYYEYFRFQIKFLQNYVFVCLFVCFEVNLGNRTLQITNKREIIVESPSLPSFFSSLCQSNSPFSINSMKMVRFLKYMAKSVERIAVSTTCITVRKSSGERAYKTPVLVKNIMRKVF